MKVCETSQANPVQHEGEDFNDEEDLLVWWRLTEPDIVSDDYDAEKYFGVFEKFVGEFSPGRETLTVMLAGAPLETLLALAHRNTTSPLVLRVLADETRYGKVWLVFEGVAKNPRTPPESLAGIAGCRRMKVRCALAGNPNTPERILHTIAEDTSDETGSALLGNEKVPVSVLRILAEKGTPNVAATARNKLRAARR